MKVRAKRQIVLISLCISIGLSSLIGCEANRPAPQSTSTAVRITPAPAPQETPTFAPTSVGSRPTPAAINLADLPSELFYGGGGGGRDICLEYELQPGDVLPMVKYLDANVDVQILCAFGFPPGEMITVQLLDNSVVSSHTYEVKNQTASSSNPTTSVTIEVWWPATMPTGRTWLLQAQSDSGSAAVYFAPEARTAPLISMVPRANLDLFETGSFEDVTCSTIERSAGALLVGINLTPRTDFPVGLYRYQPIAAQLRYSDFISTGPDGRFEGELSLNLDDPPGLYFVVLAENPASDQLLGIGLMACFNLQ